MSKEIPTIKDKFDTESARKIIAIGYPANSEKLQDFIFWSCFANDPVAAITYPYIQSLPDKVLVKPYAEFITFNTQKNQQELVNIALDLIDARGVDFRKLVERELKKNRPKLFE